MLPILLTHLALSSFPTFFAVPQEQSSRAPALLDHAAVQRQVREIAGEHTTRARSLEYGRSRSGRALIALHLGPARSEVDRPGRPAVLLVAGLDGPYAYTSSLALDLARRTLESTGEKDWLAETDLYIVPRANPDACEGRFAVPLVELRATGHGVDNDRDVRNGEDGLSDVNGDGKVTWMRVLDPDGEWLPDPFDERVLIRADPALGQRGMYTLWPEGFDSDGDEQVGEDPVHDAEVNRNFPHGYEENAPESGRYPTDEPECLALIEFVLARPEIALVLVLGEQDNLFKTPKGVPDDVRSVKRVPKPGLLASDAEFVKQLGKRFRAATGFKAEGEGESNGSFQAWCYEERGLWTLCVRPWSLPEQDPAAKDGDDENGDEDKDKAESDVDGDGDTPDGKKTEGKKSGGKKPGKGDPKPSADTKHLAWIDAENESQRFMPWTPFEHPELGPVEIGGFSPFARVEPPHEELGQIAEKLFAFFQGISDLPARLAIGEFERESQGGGLVRVRATLQNNGYLPLMATKAQRTNTVRPAKVEIQLPDGAQLLAGKPFVLLEELGGSGARKEFEWLYFAPPDAAPATVSVSTDHAGHVQFDEEVR